MKSMTQRLKESEKREREEDWKIEKVRRKITAKMNPEQFLQYLQEDERIDLLNQDFRRTVKLTNKFLK